MFFYQIKIIFIVIILAICKVNFKLSFNYFIDKSIFQWIYQLSVYLLFLNSFISEIVFECHICVAAQMTTLHFSCLKHHCGSLKTYLWQSEC